MADASHEQRQSRIERPLIRTGVTVRQHVVLAPAGPPRYVWLIILVRFGFPQHPGRRANGPGVLGVCRRSNRALGDVPCDMLKRHDTSAAARSRQGTWRRQTNRIGRLPKLYVVSSILIARSKT
jgi:hypothetical protein